MRAGGQIFGRAARFSGGRPGGRVFFGRAASGRAGVGFTRIRKIVLNVSIVLFWGFGSFLCILNDSDVLVMKINRVNKIDPKITHFHQVKKSLVFSIQNRIKGLLCMFQSFCSWVLGRFIFLNLDFECC